MSGVRKTLLAAAVTACAGLVCEATDLAEDPSGPGLASVRASAASSVLLVGETTQLTAVAERSDGSAADVTFSERTLYSSTNPAVITVSAQGLVTAGARGQAAVIVEVGEPPLISISTLVAIEVRVAGDSDGDGMTDAFEEANGLDPASASDGEADPDADGLSNREEFEAGTNPHTADSDSDGFPDGMEVRAGTDPLSFDEGFPFVRVLALSENCTASVLNRSVQVQPDGTFSIPNLPADGGLYRVRVVCTEGGMTFSGQSNFFSFEPGEVVFFENIVLEAVEPIPASISLSAPATLLTAAGETVQLTVTGTFPDGSLDDLTLRSSGTSYTTSNSSIATVSPDGLVTAEGSGSAVIAAFNEGVLASISIRVELDDDADGDGLPDDYEQSNSCLQPATPDAGGDPDGDGLTNLAEFDGGGVPGFAGGTDPCTADTDGDGLGDGVEAGSESNPVLADSDLDGLLDGSEPAGDADVDGLPNVRDPDSDNDGLRDGAEVRICGTPFCASPTADDDGDGLRNEDEAGLFTDPLDPDSDDDGLTDGEEALRGTDPLVPDRTPPTVALAAPAPGSEIVEGELLAVRADPADDGRVARVDYLLDGAVAASSLLEPFEVLITIPIDITTLAIEAVATDTNRNSAGSGAQSFPVIQDPLTIVSGFVLDASGAPVPGAEASVRLPDVLVETGAADLTGGAFAIDSETHLGVASVSGTLAFDPGALPLLGEAVDLAAAGGASMTGTLTLDFTGLDPLAPRPLAGSLGLAGSTPSGLSISMEGVVDELLPAAGEALFAVDLAVTAYDSAGLALAEPLQGRSAVVHLQGTLDITTDPVTREVTSFRITGGVEHKAELDFGGATGPDGSFSIPDVPTIFGGIVVDARTVDAGGFLRRGSSAPAPFVRGGNTDVGDITIRALSRARRDFPIGGSNPLSMAVGDLNGDGALDAATANALSDNFSVLLGRGDGTYDPPRVFGGVGARPRGITIGDWNGDGRPDLAVANENSHTVTSLLARADGSFEAVQSIGVGFVPGSIATGRLNTDLWLDLAVTNFSSASVSVLLGNGNGTFQAARNFATGNNPTYVVIANFDADPALDLAVAAWGGNHVAILLGLGDGSFQSARNFTVGDRPRFLAAADLDGNGALDLAAPNERDHNVSVLLGNGDGTFQAALNFATGTFPFGVAAGDVTGDGIPDLAVTSAGTSSLAILRGAGGGNFQTSLTLLTGPSPDVPAIADLNGDGRNDLAVSVGPTNSVSVFIGRGDGSFETDLALGTRTNPRAIASGDLDSDGSLDLVTANFSSGDVSVLLGRGDGTFQTMLRFVSLSRPHHIAVRDVDGDGALDLATALYDSDAVSILYGNGNGTFSTTPQPLSFGRFTTAVAVEDVNGDGTMDILATERDLNQVSVRLGAGSRTFLARSSFAAGSGPLSLAVRDLDGDGRLDLAVVNSLSNDVSVLAGAGDGTFGAARSFAVGTTPFWLDAGDVNRDGIPDLVTANDGPDTVSVLIGRGDGSFEMARSFPAGMNPRGVAIQDLDGDGAPDLAVANDASNNVAVLLGRGNGTFRAPTFYGARARSTFLVTVDFNRDGLPDLATANFDSNSASVLLGRGGGGF